MATRGDFSGNMKNNDFGMGPNGPGAFHGAFWPFGIRVKRESKHTFEPHSTESRHLVGCLRIVHGSRIPWGQSQNCDTCPSGEQPLSVMDGELKPPKITDLADTQVSDTEWLLNSGS